MTRYIEKILAKSALGYAEAEHPAKMKSHYLYALLYV